VTSGKATVAVAIIVKSTAAVFVSPINPPVVIIQFSFARLFLSLFLSAAATAANHNEDDDTDDSYEEDDPADDRADDDGDVCWRRFSFSSSFSSLGCSSCAVES
jgi:hypothetical protein